MYGRRSSLAGARLLLALSALSALSAACGSGTRSSVPAAAGPEDASRLDDASVPRDAMADDEGSPSQLDASPADGAPAAGPMPDASCLAAQGAPGPCTDSRPQLTEAGAGDHVPLAYLAQAGVLSAGLVKDDWDPTAGVGDVTTFVPTFRVSASGGTHTTVQAAIDAAVAQGGTDRIYVSVAPGTYREVVCVPAVAPPITLYGTGADATQTTIVYDNYNGEAKDAGGAVNRCTPPSSTSTTFGTAGSATFAAFAAGFEAENITFSNDVSVATLAATSGTQAVALMTEADKIVLENVRVLGHQDSLYVETPGGTIVRAYVKGSYVAGDVDFIFGGAALVLDGCQIEFVSDRRASGDILAPSTDSRAPYGVLVTHATITADANTAAGVVGLGRAWDRSTTDLVTYVTQFVDSCDYPNGEAVVRDSTLGASIASAPWQPAATTKRAFCSSPWVCLADAGASGVCPANRLFEFDNGGPGAQ
jgi:pectinesterase